MFSHIDNENFVSGNKRTIKMATIESRKPEQWEALIVEPSQWRRTRVADYSSSRVSFDSEDSNLLDDGLQKEFVRMGGADVHVKDVDRIDHPLARFYRLMYTDEFQGFRSEVFRDSFGVAGMSEGVRELLMDQTFRYFTFVRDSPVEAIRFGQLICSIAVFRNTYDEDAKKFVEGGILKSRRHLFKPQDRISIGKGRGSFRLEYESLDHIGIPAEYETEVAKLIQAWEMSPPLAMEELDMNLFSLVSAEDLGLYTPLPVNTAAYSPARTKVLHVMQVLGMYVPPASESVDIIYSGNLSSSILQMIREVLPGGFRLFPSLDKLNASNPTVIFLDNEADKEASASFGDDNMLTEQFGIIKALETTFRGKTQNLLAVSVNFRAPYVQSGPGRFEFLPGKILLTPWKNPQDERRRMIWTPELGSELITYNSSLVRASRKTVDYVLRSLVRVKESEKMDTESQGLIDGEFDSELERKIVSRFYNSFSMGQKSWMETAPDDIITFPRFIGEEPMFRNISLLERFFKYVIEHHVSIPSNPLLTHASRCSRAGLFCMANLAESPLKESMNKLFGKNGSELLKAFETVESDKRNVILMIREKDIYPRVREKTIAYSMIKETTPNLKELVFFEPSLRDQGSNFIYEMVGKGEERTFSLIHLGDTLGNTLLETVENLIHLRARVGEIIYESSFSLSDIWKNISPENIPFRRLKNAFSLKEQVEKSRFPFLLIRGYGYPDDVFETVVRSLSPMDSYMGYIHVVNQRITAVPLTRQLSSRQIFARSISDRYGSEMRGDKSTVMIIGSEYEFDLSFLGEHRMKRVFHVVESGAGGRRVSLMTRKMPRMKHTVFVMENLTSQFVNPIQDIKISLIIINQAVFSRIMKNKDQTIRFLTELKQVMDSSSTVLILDLENIWKHMMERGRATMEGRGAVFDSPYISGSVNETSFQLPGISGGRYRVSDVQELCREVGMELSVDRSGDFSTSIDEPLPATESEDLSPYSLARMVNVMVMRTRLDTSGKSAYSEPYEAYEGRSVDMGEGVRSYNNLVKRGLIQGVKADSRVLDLACGHGQDIQKWFSHESLELYVGMDASQQAIQEADHRIRTRRGFKPRTVRMVQADVFGSQGWVFDAEDYLRSRDRYNVVSCQLAIHYAFKDEKTIKRFMYNVSKLMERGGEFIVTTIDSQALRNMKFVVAGERAQARGEYFQISMPIESYEALLDSPVVVPGVSYEFIQFPSDPLSRTTTEYVVDMNYFKQLAEDMGLKLVRKMNFLEFDGEEGDEMERERSMLRSQDKELVGLYASYQFEKVNDVKDYLPETVKPLSISESAQQYQEAKTILEIRTGERLGKFTNGLFQQPRELFPAPFVGTGYERMDVVTDDIGEVIPMYRRLKENGRLSTRENIHLMRTSGSSQYQYDMVYLSYSAPGSFERYLDEVKQEGSIIGTFVSMETAERILMGDSEFANSVFELVVDRDRKLFSINSTLEGGSYPLFDVAEARAKAGELGLTFELMGTEEWQRDSGLTLPQKQFLSIFGMFRITKTKPLETPIQSQVVEQESQEGVREEVDKFVLLPGLVQKKAPGRGRDETLRSQGSVYRDLARDTRWRFKLSDDWETTEFPVRMPSGESFSSVTNAMIFYKCQFAEEENRDYMGLNLSTGLPVPTDMKPFTRAIRGKRGQEWKEREPLILISVYEAKFTNTPNASDEPDNLTPLRALLLTGEAQLYSNSRTRNELMENVRSSLQRIVGN
jgi:SAM-dependent methyltransferase